jgi:predicted XRE-type DNA-binding protein
VLTKDFTEPTVIDVTVREVNTFASSTFALQSAPRKRAAARLEALMELQEMSKEMVKEEGFLNYAQAGLILDVSTKRVSELVRLRKLKRFEFLGRTYVSLREVAERLAEQVKAGRPRRSFGQRLATTLKIIARADAIQLGVEGVRAKGGRKPR